MAARERVPRYYYESRSRYFAKNFGGVPGLVVTNLLWLLGRGVARISGVFRKDPASVCEGEGRDNWINWRQPLVAPSMAGGGEP